MEIPLLYCPCINVGTLPPFNRGQRGHQIIW
uniref:Uncharacterized protein n=1 Tax=Anguilla anguilla TaxID=7936 RepID=A0A0E9VXA4_ANGAN